MNINKIDPHGATLYSDSRLNVVCNGYAQRNAAPELRSDGTPVWYNLGELLLTPPRPEWLELQNKIRSAPDEAAQKALKGEAFGFTPSGYFGAPYTDARGKYHSQGRTAENLLHANALIWLDFDGKDSTGENVNFGDLINVLSKWPCICYIGRSIRGQGYHAGVAVPRDNAAEMHAARAAALIIDLEPHFGEHLDKSCVDISRLRYYAYTDPKVGYIMHYPENYERFYIAPPAPQPTAKNYTLSTTQTGATSQRPGDVFNDTYSPVDVLTAHGWQIVQQTPTQTHLRRPGAKTTNSDATYYTDNGKVKIWSTSAGLPTDGEMTAFEVYTRLEHGGTDKHHFAAAARALKAAGVQ